MIAYFLIMSSKRCKITEMVERIAGSYVYMLYSGCNMDMVNICKYQHISY